MTDVILTDADRAAAEELALEMQNPFEACKFLRSQSSLSLRECHMWTNRLISSNPRSALALGTQFYASWRTQ